MRWPSSFYREVHSVVVVSSCKRRKYLQLDEGPVRAYRHNGRAQHSFESIAPVLSLLSIFRVSPSIRFFKKSKNKSQRDIPQCVAPPPSPCSYPLLRLSRMLGQGGFTSCATFFFCLHGSQQKQQPAAYIALDKTQYCMDYSFSSFFFV